MRIRGFCKFVEKMWFSWWEKEEHDCPELGHRMQLITFGKDHFFTQFNSSFSLFFKITFHLYYIKKNGHFFIKYHLLTLNQ